MKTGIRSRSIAAGRSAARKDTPCPRRRKASAIPEMCPTEPPARRPLQRSDRRNRSEEGRRRGSTAGGFRWARAREARTVHIRGREEPACSPRKIHAGNCEVSRGLQPRRSTRPPRSRKVFRGARARAPIRWRRRIRSCQARSSLTISNLSSFIRARRTRRAPRDIEPRSSRVQVVVSPAGGSEGALRASASGRSVRRILKIGPVGVPGVPGRRRTRIHRQGSPTVRLSRRQKRTTRS